MKRAGIAATLTAAWLLFLYGTIRIAVRVYAWWRGPEPGCRCGRYGCTWENDL